MSVIVRDHFLDRRGLVVAVFGGENWFNKGEVEHNV